MKLNKRLVLVILPIALVSSCAAAFVSYKSLRASTIELEMKTLDARLTELVTSFNQYQTYAESHLYATISSKKMQRYIKDDKNYRELSLRSGFKQTLAQFDYQNSKYISFTITELANSRANIVLDITRSEDPFIEPYGELQSLSEEMLNSGTIAKRDYVEAHDGRQLFVVSQLIDANTFEAPLPTHTENSYAVQIAIEPSEFLALLDKLLQDYPASVSFNNGTRSPDAMPVLGARVSYSKEKDSGKYIQVAVKENFYQDKIGYLQFYFLLFGALFTVANIALTIALIRRYITRPISNLENDIVRVSEGTIENISHDPLAKDEINSLARSFSNLYGELTSSYNKVTEMNDHDPLTGLYNLPYITNLSAELLSSAEQSGNKVAFIYIDLDNFKFVNDQFGHSTGDELLKAFTRRLQAKFRSAGRDAGNIISARIGGDEFCVIYQGDTSEESLNGIAARILSIFDNGFSFDAGKLPIKASIGISMYPDDGRTVSELISAADTAMYAAKSSGKNRFAYYNHDLWLAINRRQEIENALKSCIPDKEFELVYMPLVSVEKVSVSGFEALIRWQSPTLGNVSPAEFVPIAESCGLFVKIDEWVTKNAFKQYAALSALVNNDIKLSINLSSAQLNSNNLSNYISRQASLYGVKPDCIQFEITETLNIEFNKQAGVFLNALIDEGYHIAIDDFGCGYTSLLQLVEFPAKMIKFDKTFIDKTLDGDNRNMLKPLVELCHSQDLEVTVEGVETHEQASYLASLGSDFLQGYYFGKPVRLDALAEVIAQSEQRLQELSRQLNPRLVELDARPLQHNDRALKKIG